MPMLTPDERRQMVRPLGVACATCSAEQVRCYCRSCDDFYTLCACPDAGREHAAHRIYVWTPAGILAIPDFDVFPDD